MAQFCTKCGKQLKDGEHCTCATDKVISRVKGLFKDRATEANGSLFKRDTPIVPDLIRPDEGEIPIKQYRFARLRSKLRGQYAEGYLQVTNKRLVFHAPGLSTVGKTLVHHEFEVNSIAGIDVQQGTRLSVLNVIGGLLLTLLISAELRSIFEAFYNESEFAATFVAVLLFLVCAVCCAFIKKKYWFKLAGCALGIGALLGTTGLSFSALDIVFGFKLFTITNICIFILAIIWFVILLRVCFVPDLIFSVKTSGASEAISIRRREWGFFFKQPQEFSGYSEVLPWRDTSSVAEELGALIDDLKTIGDLAVDKWKEN